MNARIVWVLFVVLVACALAALVGVVLRRAGGARAPHFELTERSGRTVTKRDLIGEVWVADFVFTRCQWTCPAMNSAVHALRSKFPAARFVTFSVDPQHDTPEAISKYVETNGLARDGWLWLTGKTDEEMRRIAEAFLLPVGRAGPGKMEILHSSRLVLVDRYGRIRMQYPVVDDETLERRAGVMEELEKDLAQLLARHALPILKLPSVSAALNGTSGVLLLVGLVFIKGKRAGAHKACMLGALACSALFLANYLTTHYYLGSMPYRGEGWRRPLYYSILLTHTVLAALVVPLALTTVYRAFRAQFDRHARLARWTFPIWLYVSVTGVVIYLMLYG
jgi:protein SCO1/2/putative membrane protein